MLAGLTRAPLKPTPAVLVAQLASCVVSQRSSQSLPKGSIACRSRYARYIRHLACASPSWNGPACHSGVDASIDLPLCKRPPVAEVSFGNVFDWKQQALRDIDLVGDSFEVKDNGPSRKDLEASRPSAEAAWQPVTWRQIQLEAKHAWRQKADPSAWLLLLRADLDSLREMWRSRLQERVPFQYLVSTAHWRNFVLSVGPGVLIPRPETEQMVDLAAAACKRNPHLLARPWLDLGTGSGAIALGLADMLRKHQGDACSVWAVDVSETAVAYAKSNATLAGLSSLVHVVQGRWYEPVRHLKGSLGGLLSNPPYIPQRQMQELQAEVGLHEPALALAGGEGPGMDSLMEVCVGAVDMLAPDGFLALETAGSEQAAQVAELLRSLRSASGSAAAFCNVQVVSDCYGVERFVTALRTHD